MDICPAGITEVMSCDGTATSKRWCCGNSTDCCSTNIGVVTLNQFFDAASTSSVGSIPILSAKHSRTITSGAATETETDQTDPNTTSTAEPNARRVTGGVVAGVVTGAIVGLGVLVAAFCIVRRKSHKRIAEEKVIEDSLLAEACGMSQRHELSPSAQKGVQELSGMQPGELPGDARLW